MDLTEPAQHRWQLGRRGQWWFDLALVGELLLSTLAFLVSRAPLSWALFSLGHFVPLLWRRRYPVAVFAVVAGVSVVQALIVDSPLFSDVAFPVAIYSIARFSRWRPAAVALLVGLIGAAVASVDWLGPYSPGVTVGTFTPYFLTISAIVEIGRAHV